MAEALKNIYNTRFFEHFVQKVIQEYPDFNTQRFLKRVQGDEWEVMELKERMRHITQVLHAELPPDYREAITIIRRIAPHCEGFPYMFFPDFVQVYGFQSEHEDESLELLRFLTAFSSSEFAIRPFIKRNPGKVLPLMLSWAKDPNHHVRRLCSEGCRPRLPWAMALHDLQKNPEPILPILELLYNDESEYVRRSIANNLNDISKDHPEIVMNLAHKWYGKNPATNWVVKHGLRTLLKKGNRQMLHLIGYGQENVCRLAELRLTKSSILIGESVDCSITLQSTTGEDVQARFDIAIQFVKKSGDTSQKIFAMRTITIKGDGLTKVTRKLRFQDFTTRTHYPGLHTISVIINGQALGSIDLMLFAADHKLS